MRRVIKPGVTQLSELFDVQPPELQVLLVLEEDWEKAPRESERSYPFGLPYFTRSIRPSALVIPQYLSAVIRPSSDQIVIWHELAHAFLLQKEVVRTPVWLQEFIPQAAAWAVAKRLNLPVRSYLLQLDQLNRNTEFTIREFEGPANARTQMDFQNLLLLLGAAARGEFGEGYLKRLVHALWEEREIVDEGRAEELLASSLGPGGRAWLLSRPEF